MVSLRSCIVALVAIESALPNAGSKFLDQSMLSHTDHICMAFSQMCGNKCLPQMNSLLEKLTSLTCCICVIFLPCFTTLVAVICFLQGVPAQVQA